MGFGIKMLPIERSSFREDGGTNLTFFSKELPSSLIEVECGKRDSFPFIANYLGLSRQKLYPIVARMRKIKDQNRPLVVLFTRHHPLLIAVGKHGTKGARIINILHV